MIGKEFESMHILLCKPDNDKRTTAHASLWKWTRNFTSCQQQAFSSAMRPYTSDNNRQPNQRNIQSNNSSLAQPRQNNNNNCRPSTHHASPFQQQNRGARPPFRPISSNTTNQRRPPNNNNTARQNPSTSNTANIVCNNCGRLGHYA
jgi:hypothetical protein